MKLREYFKASARHNLQILGIERTFEIIESLKNPVYRAKMCQLHLEVLKENKERK